MRSWLYVPANSPKMILRAGLYGSDGIVFDLEDSVAPEKKEEARILLAEALKDLDFGSVLLAVRINGPETSWWRDDLRILIRSGIRLFRLPKIEGAEDVSSFEEYVRSLEQESDLSLGAVRFHCLLETPRGVENAFSVASSSPRIDALSFGAEDYCSALGIRREGPLFVLDYPRSRIASAAAAFGREALDTAWGLFSDLEGLEEDALRAKQLGFTGKSVIHPDQIDIVNRIFSPSEEDVLWARKIADESERTGKSRNGAFAVDGRMIDLPVLRRAERILERLDSGGSGEVSG